VISKHRKRRRALCNALCTPTLGVRTLGLALTLDHPHGRWIVDDVEPKRVCRRPKNRPVIILPGAIVCATVVCRSFSVHRFGQCSRSNRRPIWIPSPLFSKKLMGTRSTQSTSRHPFHSILLRNLQPRDWRGEGGQGLGGKLRLCTALLCPVIVCCSLRETNNAVYKNGTSHSLGRWIAGSALLRRRVTSRIGSGRHARNPPSAWLTPLGGHRHEVESRPGLKR